MRIDDIAGKIPDNVPSCRIVDFDLFNLSGNGSDFDEPWHELYKSGLQQQGLLWTPHNEGHWIAANAQVVADVFFDHESFSNRVTFIPKSIGEMHHMLPTNIDVPQHIHYKRLLGNSLSPRAVNKLRDVIAETCNELIDSFIDDGHCDFMAQYAEHLPIRVFMNLVQLPLSDASKLKYLADEIVRPSGALPYDEVRAALEQYLTPFIDARLGGDGADMLSEIINGKIDGRPLTRDEMFKFCVQLLIGGLDTVVNQLGFVLLFLARNAEAREQLSGDAALIPRALDEMMRRYSIACTSREVKKDIDYRGVKLKKGDMILATTPVVGFDESLAPDPQHVDFTRKRPAMHVAFGRGEHICPGMHLARAELGITVERWLERIPRFSVAANTSLKFGGGIVITIAKLPLVWGSTSPRR